MKKKALVINILMILLLVFVLSVNSQAQSNKITKNTSSVYWEG